MRVLVADIGGTKTGLAVAEITGATVRLSAECRFPSREFASLEDILTRFMEEAEVECDLASFAVAGPVHEDRSQTTNLPWDLDARSLERVPGFRSVRLLNDLEAVAWGIDALKPGDLEVLHPGEEGRAGNACVVAAGTGLGEAGLYWDGSRHRPYATEGGHADFAPSDERESALLGHLQRRYGHVSWERVVSGMGIENIFDFLVGWRKAEIPEPVSREIAMGDAAAAIAGGAAGGHCPICAETMELFFRLYGREAGNAALKHMAVGGVYLGGGIAPKNLGLLRGSGFLEAFLDKGRMASLMQQIPVKVIVEQRAPLFGAARFMAAT